MTVAGFWKLLKQQDITPTTYDLKKLNLGRKAIINMDASIYIWLCLKNSKYIEELSCDYAVNYDISCYLHRYFEDYRNFFAKYNCELQLVFDGACHPNKEKLQKERREGSAKAKLQLKEFIQHSEFKYSDSALNKI